MVRPEVLAQSNTFVSQTGTALVSSNSHNVQPLLSVDVISGGRKGSCGDLVLMCHRAGCGPPPRAKKSPLSDAAPSQSPNLALFN